MINNDVFAIIQQTKDKADKLTITTTKDLMVKLFIEVLLSRANNKREVAAENKTRGGHSTCPQAIEWRTS